MTDRRTIHRIMLAASMLVVLLYCMQPIKFGDFWWHISTGRWIVEHKALPTEDPFTYTSGAGYERRKNMILKGFWVSDIIYALVYQATGFPGLVLLASLVFVLIVAYLTRFLIKRGLDPPVALALVLPLVFLFDRYIEVRPQTFSFLLALMLFDETEGVRQAMHQGNKPNLRQWIAAPVLMVLWANMHRGVMVGHAIILVAVGGEFIRVLIPARRKAAGLSPKRLMPLGAWGLIVLGASLLNPNHIMVVIENIRELTSSQMVANVEEFMPAWRYAAFIGKPGIMIGLVAMSAVSLWALIANRTRLDPVHILLYAGFAFAGFWSFRFMMFFLLIGTAISAPYLAQWLKSRGPMLTRLVAVWIVIVLCLLGVRAIKESSFNKGLIETQYLPVEAVSFISRVKPAGPIFNPYEWGGYLSWTLWPEYKTFIDSRSINPDAYKLYRTAKQGKVSDIFEKYGVQTVAFYYLNPISDKVPAIIFSMLKSPGWRMIYLDDKAVIFSRGSAGEGIQKNALWDALVRHFEARSTATPGDTAPFEQLAIVHYARGNRTEASKSLTRALALAPQDASLKTLMAEIGSGNKGK